ncbi:VirK/YbjX family protein [uncultured Selenomonas sp.]|uniref:VirK/YbjX family protein n=1 Tax=uncultured Selenomonas sp. TaxID=159275 RepID=UPI0025CC9639|nr:VirK/YbjX family protein [uncultured Selenomonas sp.]
MISDIVKLGKRIYRTENPRELHRFIVFLGRSEVHRRGMKELFDWFQSDPARKALLARHPFPMEQVTRAFFYAGSTFRERKSLICHHYALLQEKLTEENFQRFGALDANYEIWNAGAEDVQWYAKVSFSPGQRKEGLLAVTMMFGEHELYQIIFWLDYDKQGEESLFIGAMQGPNMEHAKDIIKDVTKRSHRYRTKNLILYMTQAVARSLGMKHIYAVTNAGYYAQNHVRRDRKLKTDFGAFWEEAGGQPTDDPRFDELPLVEPRKTMEEVPTRKRAVYRRRFAFLDDVDAQIAANMAKVLRQPEDHAGESR